MWTTVFDIFMHSLYVFLQLIVKRESSRTNSTCEWLHTVHRMFPVNVPETEDRFIVRQPQTMMVRTWTSREEM